MIFEGKISVIVPVYNVEKYLDRCIKSIVNQTYRNLEILLINDGSCDYSGSICDKWENEDYRIKVINQVNSGVSAARNKGLDHSTGDYITFVDSDDYIEENFCEILYEALVENDVDIAYCNKFSNNHIDSNELIKISSKQYDPVFKVSHCFVWGALYKKKILDKMRFNSDLYVGEDSYFFAQAVKNSDNIIHIDKSLYHYIFYDNSAYNGGFNTKKYTELESWRRICLLYEDNKQIQKKCKAALAIRCTDMIVRFVSDSKFTNEYKKETIKEYRRNVWFLILCLLTKHKYISIIKEIEHTIFPHLWLKYLTVKKK